MTEAIRAVNRPRLERPVVQRAIAATAEDGDWTVERRVRMPIVGFEGRKVGAQRRNDQRPKLRVLEHFARYRAIVPLVDLLEKLVLVQCVQPRQLIRQLWSTARRREQANR